jgi:hypothetical protein
MSYFNVNPVIKGPELVLDTALRGVETELGKGHTVVVSGTAMSAHELTLGLREYDDVYKNIRRIRGELAKAYDALRKAKPDEREFLKAFKAGLVARFGESNPELAKFGFKPKRQPQPLTSEEKAQRAEKNRQTRQARHTLGPRQREAIPTEPSNPTPPTTASNGGASSHAA